METVYVLGPIHIHGESYIPVYEKLVELCEKHFQEILATYPDFWDTEESPEEFYRHTMDKISGYDLFIAEVTDPSLGVGMELRLADEENIPVIALAEEGVEVSSMVLGLPNLVRVIRYSDTDDLVEKLEAEIGPRSA